MSSGKITTTTSILLLAAAGLLLLAACGARATQITGGGRAAVLEYAEPAAENLIAGLRAGDYEQFTRGMSPEMKAAMGRQAFDDLRVLLDDKVGAYVSREVSSVGQTGGFVNVIYDARFENEEHVTMRLVFDQNNLISGLWFDSARLRQ